MALPGLARALYFEMCITRIFLWKSSMKSSFAQLITYLGNFIFLFIIIFVA